MGVEPPPPPASLDCHPDRSGPAFSHPRLCERRFTPRNEGPRSGGIVATSLTATQPRHVFALARPLPFLLRKPTTKDFCSHCHPRQHHKRISPPFQPILP